MLLKRLREILATRHNIRAHFWQSLANYSHQISGLVIGVLLARLLQPENFGEFAYITSVLGLFVLPASWSLTPQIVSEASFNPGIVNDALWFSRRIVFARAVLALLACLFLAWTQGVEAAALGLVIALPLAGAEFVAVLRATLEGRGQFKVNFYDSLLTAVSTACIALPAAWLGAGTWAFVIPTIPLFLGQMWLFTTMANMGVAPSAPASGKRYFRSSFALWLVSMGEGVLFRADKFFLGKFSTFSALGDYNRASNYAPISARLLNSLFANPTVAGLARATDSQARRRLIAKSAALLMMGGLVNFAVLWWGSATLVPWIFGAQWATAVPVFEAMASFSLVMSFTYLPTAILLAARAYTYLALVRVASVTIFVMCALWIGPYLNAVTMAFLLQGILIVQGIFLMPLSYYYVKTPSITSTFSS